MTAILCPRCGNSIDPAQKIFCQSCGTAHHWSCYHENGCAMQSCSAAGLRPTPAPQPAAAPAAVAVAPQAAVAPAPPATPQQAYLYNPPYYPKSRLAYILLGIFVGTLGIHNFYAGYTGRGIAQLLITVLTFGLGGIVTFIWAIVEVCTINVDARGVPFTN